MLEGERSPTAPAKLIASTDTANAIALCILDLGQEHYKRKYMSTYHEVRRLAENLTPDEQMRLIEELFSLIRQRVTLTPKLLLSKPRYHQIIIRFKYYHSFRLER